jgi:hypothetical protein
VVKRGRQIETMEDPYATLGVATDASQQDIARAYRRLAHTTHPDSLPDDPGASARFRALSGAYGILGDPYRRAQYDHAHVVRKEPERVPDLTTPPGTPSVRVRVGSPLYVREQERMPRPPSPPIWAGPVLWKPSPGVVSRS